MAGSGGQHWEDGIFRVFSNFIFILRPGVTQFKGTLPLNMFIIKTGRIGHINSLNIGGLKKLF